MSSSGGWGFHPCHLPCLLLYHPYPHSWNFWTLFGVSGVQPPPPPPVGGSEEKGVVFSILVKIREQGFRAVLDTGATLSILALRLLKTFKKTKTVAIRVRDWCTIHSLGGIDVTICLGDKTVTQHCRVLDTDAFDIVIGTDFLRRNPQVKMLCLQRPYSLHCDFCSGLFSVPLELSGRKECWLRYAAKTSYRT